MASQNGDILLTIKSLFKGEGFTKADQAIKSTAKSAKTATDSISKVTNALGTLDGKAGKVAGTMGSLFQSFAHGGVIGLAIGGITTAFSAVLSKIQEVKKRSEEAAKAIAKAFEDKLSNIRVNLKSDIDTGNATAESSKLIGDAYAKYSSDSVTRRISSIKAEGELRRAKMTDSKQIELDRLNEEKEIQRLKGANAVSSASKDYSDAQSRLALLQEQNEKSNSANAEEKKMMLEQERRLRAEVAKAEEELNVFKSFSMPAGDYVVADFTNVPKKYQDKLDSAKARLSNLLISNSERMNQMSFESDQREKRISAASLDVENAKANLASVKQMASSDGNLADAKYATALAKSEEEAKKDLQNFKNFLAGQKRKLEQDLEAGDAKKKSLMEENSKKREKASLEELQISRQKETAKEIERLNKSIRHWSDQAVRQADLYNRLGLIDGQGGDGLSMKDLIREDKRDAKGRQRKLEKDRRWLLSKMEGAWKAGGAKWDEWQDKWHLLNGNPQDKIEEARKKQEELQAQLASDVRTITERMKELGL